MAWNVLTGWNLRIPQFLISGPDSLHYHLLSEVVYGFRQHLLLRFDPHRLAFLYTERHLNLLPREIWQRLLPSTDRPLLKWKGKKAQVHPQFRGKAVSTLQAQHIIEHRWQELPIKPVLLYVFNSAVVVWTAVLSMLAYIGQESPFPFFVSFTFMSLKSMSRALDVWLQIFILKFYFYFIYLFKQKHHLA